MGEKVNMDLELDLNTDLDVDLATDIDLFVDLDIYKKRFLHEVAFWEEASRRRISYYHSVSEHQVCTQMDF